MDSITLDELPDDILLHVVLDVNIQDLFRLRLTSRTLYRAVQNDYVWRYHIGRRYGIPDHLMVAYGLHSNSLGLLLKTLYLSDKKPGLVGLRAVYCDGGMDDNKKKYHVNNLFNASQHSHYCSEVGSRISIVAEATPSSNMKGSTRVELEERAIITNFLRLARAEMPHIQLSNLVAFSLRDLRMLLLHFYNGGVQMTFFIRMVLNRDNDERRLKIITDAEELAERLRKDMNIDSDDETEVDEGSEGYVHDPDDVKTYYLPGHDLRQISSPTHHYLSMGSIVFSRFEGLTCPVRSACIFVSDDFVTREMLASGVYKAFDDLLTEDDVESAVRTGIAPPIAFRSSGVPGSLIEFNVDEAKTSQRTAKGLHPLLWMRFKDIKEEEVRVSDGEEEDEYEGPEEFSVLGMGKLCRSKTKFYHKFRKAVGARYIVIKLIECQNLMSVMHDDHPEPNIDATTFLVQGTVVNMNDLGSGLASPSRLPIGGLDIK